MTIKQQGGIFGRNPSFNDLEAEQATVNGRVNIQSNRPQIFLYEQDRTDNNARIECSFDNLNISQVDDSNGSAVARLTVEMDTGDVYVNDGNLVIGTSGKGIDFSATSGTGTSELFNDYEEGTFDVTFLPQTSGSITINSSYNTMSYTKVGRVVTITGEIRVDSVSSPVGSYFTIRNLPFVVSNLTDSAGRSSGACAFYDGTRTTTAFRTVENQSYIRIDIDASTITAGNEFAFSFSYPAA